MYDKNSSPCTVGEAFGVSKDQIKKLISVRFILSENIYF